MFTPQECAMNHMTLILGCAVEGTNMVIISPIFILHNYGILGLYIWLGFPKS